MYRPLHRTHAIREAAFVIFGAEQIESSLITAIGNDLTVPWRDVAPKRNDIQQFQIRLGPGPFPEVPPSLSAPADAIEYVGLKANGELAWRVALNPGFIAINCLVYPGWETVWPMVAGWLSWIMTRESVNAFPSSGIALQYINAFPWEGPLEECRPTQLLRPESADVPPSLYKLADDRWHLHSGRFVPLSEPYKGETLQRVHLGATRIDRPDGAKGSEAVIDVYHQSLFMHAVDISGDFVRGGHAEALYRTLHDLAKDRLASYLCDRLIEEVNLYAS